jgi:hypothetical protein
MIKAGDMWTNPEVQGIARKGEVMNTSCPPIRIFALALAILFGVTVHADAGTLYNSAATGYNLDPQAAIVKSEVVPILTSFKVIPGQELRFDIKYTDFDGKRALLSTGAYASVKNKGKYTIEYEIVGKAEFDSVGSNSLTKETDVTVANDTWIRPPIATVFVKANFATDDTITVKMTIIDKEPNPAVAPNTGTAHDPDVEHTWTLSFGATPPTDINMLNKAARNNKFFGLPRTDNYELLPDIGDAGAPDYQNFAVTEKLTGPTPNFDWADVRPHFRAYYATLGINNPLQLVTRHTVGANPGGTFVVDNMDHISDRHSTSFPFNIFFANKIRVGVDFSFTQKFYCSAAAALGTYKITIFGKGKVVGGRVVIKAYARVTEE